MTEHEAPPCRVLFVFAWLVVGGEETELRLLARHLDPARWKIDVLACFRKPGMPEQTHEQLRRLGIEVDTRPYELSYEQTVEHIARALPSYDVVVACQAPRGIYDAYQQATHPPPLLEHGGLVAEATVLPKDFTARYIGVCDTIRAAAAVAMPGREQHALRIPSMVDLAEVHHDRQRVRVELSVPPDAPVLGWVGRLDRKKRVEDTIRATAILRDQHPRIHLVIVGGPDAFMPDYVDELRAAVAHHELDDAVRFLGDRDDVPRLLSGFDVLAWLSIGEGMPHIISEAGAAGVAVVATADNGSVEQVTHGVTGLLVPHGSPSAVAAAVDALLRDSSMRDRLGTALRAKVRDEFSTDAVIPLWEQLLDEVVVASRR